MKTTEELATDLEEVLRSLDHDDLQVTVEPQRGRHLVAVVTTPDFEGVNEAARQSEVWEKVYDAFDEEDQTRIDFIFTNTPDEERQMEEEDHGESAV